MTEPTYNKVINFIDKHHMIDAGDLVAVGVSGGADSVCLLHIMWRLSKERSFRIIAVHIDHGVRAEAAGDAAHVERLCREMDIPFFLHRTDMNSYAEAHKLSPEEAGRQLRYAAFEETLRQQCKPAELCKIAVAHNANDRAETMLFHLFRGTGLKGLCSIRPVRERVIRPILCLEREEIEQYLAGQKLAYCHDWTNEADEYTRNRIRHHILPYAEQEICRGAVAHMGESADILSETEEYLEKQTKRLYDKYVEEAECLFVQGTSLLTEDPVMYKRVLLACMEKLTPHRKDITGQHIADLVKLMTRTGSKELSLPYGIKAYKEYDRLILCRDTDDCLYRFEESDKKNREYMVEPPAEIDVAEEGTFVFTLYNNNEICLSKRQNISENRYTKLFDYDKITTALMLRTRRQGDYLTIDTMLHTKSVKQYMINEKISRVRRDSMYILADGAHILWVPGYRISQHYKVDESTKRILQVQLRGGYHGGAS